VARVGTGFLAGAFATGLRAGEVRPRETVLREAGPRELREDEFLSGVLRSVSQENKNSVIRRVNTVQERGRERYFFMRKRNWPDYFFKNSIIILTAFVPKNCGKYCEAPAL